MVLEMKYNLVLILLFLSSCTTAPSIEASKIVEADENRVSSCRFLGSVHGDSTFGAITPEGLNQKARSNALESALALGATHIVWNSNVKTMDSSSVFGKAYDCARKD